jgi:hypothetical protein
MNRVALALAVLAAGCGDSDRDEPIDGTVAVTIASETIPLEVGAAIQDATDPTRVFVILGTQGLSCATTVTSRLAGGTYLTFTIDPTPGTQAGFVSVIRVIDSSGDLDGSSGQIVIDGVADRVTGSVTLGAIEDEAGLISAAGTFDVIRCF